MRFLNLFYFVLNLLMIYFSHNYLGGFIKKLFVLGLVVIILSTSSYFDISEQEFKALEEKGLLRNLGIGVYGSNVVDKRKML